MAIKRPSFSQTFRLLVLIQLHLPFGFENFCRSQLFFYRAKHHTFPDEKKLPG